MTVMQCLQSTLVPRERKMKPEELDNFNGERIPLNKIDSACESDRQKGIIIIRPPGQPHLAISPSAAALIDLK